MPKSISSSSTSRRRNWPDGRGSGRCPSLATPPACWPNISNSCQPPAEGQLPTYRNRQHSYSVFLIFGGREFDCLQDYRTTVRPNERRRSKPCGSRGEEGNRLTITARLVCARYA